MVDYSMPHLEGGPEYLVRWDGLGDPEWMHPHELETGTKPKLSKDHKHFFRNQERRSKPAYLICDCGEFLSWDEAQERMNQP